MSAADSCFARFLTPAIYYSTQTLPYVPTYIHLLFAALLPIVTGAYASLKRPANASRPLLGDDEFDEDDDEKEGESPQAENLTASDVLIFPLIAGSCLGGLYFVIKYLNDPTIISTVLTYYFCAIGVFSIGRGFSDALRVSASYVFPRRYRSSKDGRLYEAGYNSYKVRGGEGSEERNPLGVLLPRSMWNSVWSLRRFLAVKWRMVIRDGSGKSTLKHHFWIGDFAGLGVGILTVGAYALGGKHWLLTNVMGSGFAYGAMQLISPTTFNIATLLLVALFFYDIFFVFYTPMMVTVATTLDVPIKLLFPRPGTTVGGAPALAMLGLGDVVIPGIVIAMALRFDLWRFYEQKRLSNLSAAEKEQSSPIGSDEHDPKRSIPDLAQNTKAPYVKVTGNWGERFWTKDESKTAFSKTYFHASLVGYITGMLATLVVMHVWKHAQPALLYLVPGVLGSIWGTALARGEVKLMCSYDEDQEQKDEESTSKNSGGDQEAPPTLPDKGTELDEPSFEACIEEEEWLTIAVTKISLQPQKSTAKLVGQATSLGGVDAEEESETFSSTSSVCSMGTSLGSD